MGFPVRQASALPTASSRFHLAIDTLAVQLTLPLAGCVGDLHPQVNAPCRAHQTTRAGQVRPALVVWLRMHSEDNLQRQLGVVRLAGADAGRAVRDADGLSARPEQGTVTANA